MVLEHPLQLLLGISKHLNQTWLGPDVAPLRYRLSLQREHHLKCNAPKLQSSSRDSLYIGRIQLRMPPKPGRQLPAETKAALGVYIVQVHAAKSSNSGYKSL